MIKKLNMIDNEVRNRLIRVYMEKCSNDYNVKFNKWRIKYFSHDERVTIDHDALQAR